MKVQRFIEKYKKLEGVWDAEGAELARQIFLQDLEQLDEPEKVTIPQFVADWIEVCKEHLTSSLYLAMTPSFLKSNNQGIELTLWIKKNEETFARAWLDGYEVEEEKRYYIRLKNVDENYNYLNYIKHLNAWCLAEIKTDKKFRTTHTRKELEEAGFGWVFDCEGIEIEEVE